MQSVRLEMKWYNKLIMPQIKRKSFIQKNGLIAVWSVAGFMAMGYIGILAIGRGSDPSQMQQVASNAAVIAISPVERQLAALNDNIKKLANKTDKTSKELSLIKEAFGPSTASLPDKQPATVSVNVLPLTENDKIAVLSGDDSDKTHGIELAQARSIESLKRLWQKLQKADSSLFSGLKPHYIDHGTRELPLYSLVLGPFPLASQARGRCEQLSKAGIECHETSYRAVPNIKIQTAGK